MKNPYTRKDKKALSPEIIKAFHEAGKNRDLNAFKRLLGQYASHIPKETKEELIEEFKRNIELLRDALGR